LAQPIADKRTALEAFREMQPVGGLRVEQTKARRDIATAAMSALIQSGRGVNMEQACVDSVAWADALLEKLG
jgi:hypothetical protein